MKKVLVALAMIFGMGTTVAFAQEPVKTDPVEQTPQAPQDEFVKIEVKDIPQPVLDVLAKDYPGATIKEAFAAEKEAGKIFKIVLVVTKEDLSTEEVTVLLNEKGEKVEGQTA